MLSSIFMCCVCCPPFCFWVPVNPGLIHGLRSKVQLQKQPSPQPCPSIHLNILMAKTGVALPTTVTPHLPFLETLISPPHLAEIQGSIIGLEWNQNYIIIVNICPEINVSELMFLSNQCIRKQITLLIDFFFSFQYIRGGVHVENQPCIAENPSLSAGINVITQLMYLLVLWQLSPRSCMSAWRGSIFLIFVSWAESSVDNHYKQAPMSNKFTYSPKKVYP